jgi:phosphomannomutase
LWIRRSEVRDPPAVPFRGLFAITLRCFKTYDVRGRVGHDLDEAVAYRIGRAFAQFLKAKNIVVGCDARLSSPPLKAAVAKGMLDAGASVVDLGLTGTEEIYFASSHLDVDGGIEITASHNPADYNGMKFVGRGGRPIRIADEFASIRKLAEENAFENPGRRGEFSQESLLAPYIAHLLTYIDVKSIRPMKIVVDAGNGAAGHVIDALETKLPQIQFIKINHYPDGHFPNGVPNPLLPEKRLITSHAVRRYKADLGIAWDGDFDRCFLFDGSGEYISGYYLSGLLMSAFTKKNPDAKFVIDPRLFWDTKDILQGSNSGFVMSRTGHTFFKENMRAANAGYGGESSSHHYFHDFAYCDSGMIPWLLVVEYLSKSEKPLRDLIEARKAKFPSSDEINFQVADVEATIERVLANYRGRAASIDRTDGLSLEFDTWRFNLRGSNTEPLLRLNVETRGNAKLVDEKVGEIAKLIKGSGA